MTPRTHKAATDTAALDTEQRNPATRDLDALSPLQIARVINAEDAKVAGAVKKALPQIAHAIDAIARALSQGGRLIYVGTGSSGRIGALDASECPPTFSTDPKTVRFLMAGGVRALGAAVEANEDSRKAGKADMARLKPTGRDCVVGVAASGRTPYTIAAVAYARQKGATTIAVVCNRNTALERATEIPVVVQVGPEVVTGSTRMKAGTAQKMVLNMFSTGAMARLGYVYGNLMVNLHLKNSKLVERGIRILELATGLTPTESRKMLRRAGGRVPVAIVMTKRHVTRAQAEFLLKKSGGNVRIAIDGAPTQE